MPDVRACVARLLLLFFLSIVAAGTQAEQPQLWLYCPFNLLVPDNVEQLENLLRRAAQAGYTHINLHDSKFCRLEEMPERYFEHVARIRQLCDELKLEIVPAVFPIGWSNDLLYHDRNLAEGLPVIDALVEVRKGKLQLIADPPVALRAGDMSDLNRWSFHDETVVADEGAARIRDCEGQNARVVAKVAVSPFRQYHISLRVKTQDFTGQLKVKPIAGDRILQYQSLEVQSTQDWETYHLAFNSLENREVGIYVGCWGGGKGTLWLDDVTLEEMPPLNILRRPGAPVTIRRHDNDASQPQPVEGETVVRIIDPKLGNNPYGGNYDAWHEPPLIGSSLPEGTRLRLSYYHPAIIYGGSVMAALSEPRTMELLRQQTERVHKAWQAKAYFMEHDEIRILNWDQSSQDRKLSAGQLLASNVRECTKILKTVNPGGRIYVWSDMFDPHHNAVDNYYLVKDSLKESWLGLDRDVILVNWNGDKSTESLGWFAGRGHKQIIAGYYDAPIENLSRWQNAAAGVKGIEGLMYTTWRGDYSQLEAFARKAANDP